MRCAYESRNKGSLRAYWSSLSDQKDHENKNSGNTNVFRCKCRRKRCPTWKLYVGIVRLLVVIVWHLASLFIVDSGHAEPRQRGQCSFYVTKIVLFPIWLAQSHYMQETRRVTPTKFCVFRTGNGTLLLFRQSHSDEDHFCQGYSICPMPRPRHWLKVWEA